MRRNLAPGCISSEVNLCQRKPLFPFFRDPFFRDPFFSFFWFFFSPANVGSLEMQPGAKLQAYLGVVMLQPHACTQRFRFRILRRTRLFPGRTSVRSLPGGIEPIWETPSKERERETGFQVLGHHCIDAWSVDAGPTQPQHLFVPASAKLIFCTPVRLTVLAWTSASPWSGIA